MYPQIDTVCFARVYRELRHMRQARDDEERGDEALRAFYVPRFHRQRSNAHPCRR